MKKSIIRKLIREVISEQTMGNVLSQAGTEFVEPTCYGSSPTLMYCECPKNYQMYTLSDGSGCSFGWGDQGASSNATGIVFGKCFPITEPIKSPSIPSRPERGNNTLNPLNPYVGNTNRPSPGGPLEERTKKRRK